MAEAGSEPINVADYERLASEALDAGPLGYFAGGAWDEVTLRENVDTWRRWRLRPRMLVDVGEVSTATELLGSEISMPIVVAPVAFQRMAHEDGEPGMARAAAEAGTLMCLSTIATARPSEVAEAAPGGHLWFQLYCFRDRSVTQALIDEAVEFGYEAIVLTVDAPRLGWRERDLRSGFVVPASVTVPSVAAALGTDKPIGVAEAFALLDPTITWADLEQLVSGCDLPVLVKGVLTAEDAELALEHGAAGVIVSNHGGRQLDGVAPSAEALPEVADAISGRGLVLVDGGVRRGTDVLVALALGADAVMVGRPALWGLAADGERGALRVLQILRNELELALALAGCPSPGAVTGDHVRQAPQVSP
jgi:isopentenyl diphosphate isomerase/L-lactate dehydrogenase-like FMN-dependent dehydrogenase